MGIRGVGIVLKGPDEDTVEHALRLMFRTTNNMAEYEAIAKSLDLARRINPRRLNLYSDLQLVIG